MTTAAKRNGKPEVEPQALILAPEEAGLIYQMLQNMAFPTAQAKMAAASVQAKLEALEASGAFPG